MMRKLRVVLVADESAGLRALRQIETGAWDLVAVLSPNRLGAGVGEEPQPTRYSVWPASEVTNPGFAETLREHQVDLLLNIHSLFKIRPEVIAALRIGAFNLHPGPLPGYAGLNAPSWAIVNGEVRHAVTLHWIETGIDTGPVAFSASFPLTDRETGLSVSAKCVEHGLPLVRRLLAIAQTDSHAIPRLPQDLSQRRYFRRRDVPYGGCVPWNLPACEVDALVRASSYDPFPSPWGAPVTRLGSRTIGIARVRRTRQGCGEPPGTIGIVGGEGARVATADEWLLVARLHLDGRRTPPDALFQPGMKLD